MTDIRINDLDQSVDAARLADVRGGILIDGSSSLKTQTGILIDGSSSVRPGIIFDGSETLK